MFEINKISNLFLLIVITIIINPLIILSNNNNINDIQLDSTKINSELSTSSSFTETSGSYTFKPKNSSGIDSVIVFRAKDTIRFNAIKKTMYMRGESKLDYKAQHLNSEIIRIDFNKSELSSQGVQDSNQKYIGFPQFTDNGETFVGKNILYNFKTQEGLISTGETEVGDGYYSGSKIKRVSQSELFVQNGRYTTCNAPHPHYYFGSPEMKVIANDRVFIDPIYFYVEDMPLFVIPFGLFFPSKSGRQSGLIIPSFFFSKNRGVVFQNLGLYLALSDYYDTRFNIDYYSKGGYNLKNNTRWKIRDKLDGHLDVEYGKTRLDPDSKFQTNYKFALSHNQNLTPQSKIVANISFMSQDYNRNTNYTSLQSRLKQNITSNASYSKSYDNGSSISLAFNRDQNIITNEVRQTFPKLSFSLPQLKPLKSLIPAGTWLPDWLRDISLSYSGSGNYYTEKILQEDSSFTKNRRSSISHSPRISISPKFGYFNVNPYISFNANNYFRRLSKTYNQTDSTVSDSFKKGFFTEYNYSMGIDFSTRLYGMIKPKIFGINAVRHTFQPSVGYAYTPDLSSPDKGFYDSYYDEVNKTEVQYSRFQADGGGIASRNKSQSIRFNVLNNFEAKIFQGDTLDDKNLEFFRWNFSGNYNLVADSLKMSNIAMSFKIPAVQNLNFTANANFSVYDEAKSWNETDKAYTGNYRKINKLLIENGKGLMRLTNFNLNFSTTLASGNSPANTSQNQGEKQSSEQEPALGERFKNKIEYKKEKFDLYGDQTPGYNPLSIPWSINLSLSFQYNEPLIHQISRRINLSSRFSFQLTESWSITGNAHYDFINKQLISPSFELNKDLHCWQLSFQWWPTGYNAGFYLRLSIKAPQLKDLKIEKRSNPLFR